MNTGPRRAAHPTFHDVGAHRRDQVCRSLCAIFEDAAETYPDAVWPVQASVRCAPSSTWHTARDQGLAAVPADVTDRCSSVPARRPRRAWPRAPRPRPEEQHEAAARPRAAGILPRAPQ